MGTHQAHVAAASINQTVGAWEGNERRIREVIGAARDAGARLLLLPEMCIPGYSLGDRLLRMGTVERSWDRLMRLADDTGDIAVAVGLPVLFEGVLYNAMGLLAGGTLVGLAAKENLATGGAWPKRPARTRLSWSRHEPSSIRAWRISPRSITRWTSSQSRVKTNRRPSASIRPLTAMKMLPSKTSRVASQPSSDVYR